MIKAAIILKSFLMLLRALFRKFLHGFRRKYDDKEVQNKFDFAFP